MKLNNYKDNNIERKGVYQSKNSQKDSNSNNDDE